MSAMDFYDEDLVRARKFNLDGDSVENLKDTVAGDEIPVRPVSDLTLTRMAKHKKEVEENVMLATQELERLRKRQEELEKEKRELEELRRKQEEYQRGKRELLEKLESSLVTMEKEQLQAQRMAELLDATRQRFKDMLTQLHGINEEIWNEDKFGDELSKALALIEDLRMEFNKALSRVEAAGGGMAPMISSGVSLSEPARMPVDDQKSFAYWLKVGTAITLPLVVTMVVLMIAWFLVERMGLI